MFWPCATVTLTVIYSDTNLKKAQSEALLAQTLQSHDLNLEKTYRADVSRRRSRLSHTLRDTCARDRPHRYNFHISEQLELDIDSQLQNECEVPLPPHISRPWC